MSFCSLFVSSTDHCTLVAKEVFGSGLVDHQMKIAMLNCINVHLGNVRKMTGVGPSPQDFGKYKETLRMALKRKLSY